MFLKIMVVWGMVVEIIRNGILLGWCNISYIDGVLDYTGVSIRQKSVNVHLRCVHFIVCKLNTKGKILDTLPNWKSP